MVFPASKGVLSETLERACARAANVKTVASRARSEMAAAGYAANQVLDLGIGLRAARVELAGYGATEGIGAYAQEQFNDPTLDVSAEWNAMIAAMDNVVSWIRNNFPVGSGTAAGFLLERTWGAGGPVQRHFPASDPLIAGLVTQLDALIASIG